MRYIVIGAGSVGGVIGGALADAGRDVVLVARGAHLAALATSGLTLHTPTRTLTVRPRSVGGPEELTLTPDDVLVLSVKSQDTLPLLAQWSALPVDGGGTAGGRLPILCAQNGVANENYALRYFERVYGVCVWLPAALAEPGVVVADATPVFGVLDLGRIGGSANAASPSDAVDPTAEVLADELTTAGFIAYATDDVLPWKYGKLLGNLSNAIQAACADSKSPAGSELTRLVTAEAEAVYRSAGIAHVELEAAYAERGDEIRVAEVAGYPRRGGSTWQSLNRGLNAVEVDYLNGEIVALGRAHGIACPANEYLRQLVNGMAASKTMPGSYAAADVLADLLAVV